MPLHELIGPLLADATETIPNPHAQETPVTTPDPAAVALADAAPDNAFRTEDGGVLIRLAAGWLRIKDGYHRVLPLDAVVPGFGTGRNTVPLVPKPQPVHSPGWYRTMTTDAATERYGFPAPDSYPLEHTATDGSKWFLDQGGKGWTLSEYMDDDTHLLKVWEKAVLDAARALAAGEPGCHLIETGGTAPRGGHLRLIVDTEHGEYERLEAGWQRREDARPAEPEPGSAAWLRDLADRLQQHNANRGSETAVPEHSAETPYLIREYADEVERDERKAAADTRDRERVEKIVIRHLEERAVAALNTVTDAIGVDRVLDAHFDTYTAWATLTDEQKAEALAPALELYRAGRDDVEATLRANGGSGQGGAHHA